MGGSTGLPARDDADDHADDHGDRPPETHRPVTTDLAERPGPKVAGGVADTADRPEGPGRTAGPATDASTGGDPGVARRAGTADRPGEPGPAPGAVGMTGEQREQFEREGFLVVPGALDGDEVERCVDALDTVYGDAERLGRLAPDGSLQVLGAVKHCPPLALLLDHPAVFPLVWSILGWNVHVCHSHLNVHPPLDPADPAPFRWRWHQDGSRQCLELETDPPPRMSVFVAWWLSDVSRPGRGNLTFVPGSHRRRWLPGPPDPTTPWPPPAGAVELTARPGDAVIFDRRLWHTRSDNYSDLVRKAVFLGYTFRWVTIRDDVRGLADEPWYRELGPVARQLLGEPPSPDDGTGDHQWGHRPDDVPLYAMLRDGGLLDPANRLHRRFVP